MTIVRCEQCMRQFRIDPDLEGQTIDCPMCGLETALRSEPPESKPETVAEQAGSDDPSVEFGLRPPTIRKPPPPRHRQPQQVSVPVAIGIALIALAVGFFAGRGYRQKEQETEFRSFMNNVTKKIHELNDGPRSSDEAGAEH